MSAIKAIAWEQQTLVLLDQRKLPTEETYLDYSTARDVADAITDMVVRGAPAIGISAAFGVVLAVKQAYAKSAQNWKASIVTDMGYLRASRPTAVNLFWALDRMQNIIDTLPVDLDPTEKLEVEAIRIHEEDIAANKKMGDLGAGHIASKSGAADKLNIITHCNTGTLATGGYGTALGVIRSLFETGSLDKVYADETRPWLQGSRLTAWELQRDGIPVILNVDGAAAWLMANKDVAWVIVGADRISANGDVANKIGTYSLAVLAKHHGVKMMVVAPSSTVDMQLASGQEIEIEHRSGEELTLVSGKRVAEEHTQAINPVFDVTPAGLIDVIVTEKGLVESPTTEKMRALFAA